MAPCTITPWRDNLHLGFFDGVPATLHQLPPTEAGTRYVDFMGGADNVPRQAKESFDKCDHEARERLDRKATSSTHRQG